MGSETFLQHDNKVLMLARPRDSNFLREKAEKEGLKSLQASIGFVQLPTAGHQLGNLRGWQARNPAALHRTRGRQDYHSRRSLLLRRSAASGHGPRWGNTVVLREGTPQEWNKITFKPALVIDSYNLRSTDPRDQS